MANSNNVLHHVGVIMDGNRRWARNRGLPTLEGHTKGAWNLFYLCDWCIKRGIDEITVYVFSTYNWNRTQEEIDGLFGLVERIFREKIRDCVQKGIHINLMGDITKLPPSLQSVLYLFRDETRDCNKVILNIAINYGGREDIIQAVKAYYSSGKDVRQISMDNIQDYLYCKSNVDLVIRSGRYKRLSNFMIWQAACAELYFTETLWPDFTEENFQDAVDYYYNTTINNGK